MFSSVQRGDNLQLQGCTPADYRIETVELRAAYRAHHCLASNLVAAPDIWVESLCVRVIASGNTLSVTSVIAMAPIPASVAVDQRPYRCASTFAWLETSAGHWSCRVAPHSIPIYISFLGWIDLRRPVRKLKKARSKDARNLSCQAGRLLRVGESSSLALESLTKHAELIIRTSLPSRWFMLDRQVIY